MEAGGQLYASGAFSLAKEPPESCMLEAESLIAFQAMYRIIEMTEKHLKTSYTVTLLHILFIQLLNFWNARWTWMIYKVHNCIYN
jgi:hypothetical protein